MRSIKQGIRSTKEKKEAQQVVTADGKIITIPLRKHHDIYVKIELAKETMYTDQTGAFPVQSKSGNRYVMILCEMDSNAILSEAMKSRTGSEIIRAYKALMHRLKLAGIKPKKHILDNECSNEYKEAKLAAHGNPIWSRSVEDYLRAVAQTFLSVGATIQPPR